MLISDRDNPSKYKMQFLNYDFIIKGKSYLNLPGPVGKSNYPLNLIIVPLSMATTAIKCLEGFH